MYKRQGETIAKTEHTWGEWEKTSDATVFAAQKEKRICKLCQTTEERDNGNPLTSKMTLTASSLKMKIKQTTKAFQISGLESGDYVCLLYTSFYPENAAFIMQKYEGWQIQKQTSDRFYGRNYT